MKKNQLLILPIIALTSLMPSSSYAVYDVLLMGGGGEPNCKEGGTGKNAKPDCDSTIFDNGLTEFAAARDRLDVNLKLSFNGGHEKTEEILKKKITKSEAPIPRFTKESYESMVQEAIRKIQSGETKSGEQVLVIIDSHGGENPTPAARDGKKEKGSQATHTISLSDGIEAEDKNKVKGASLDILIELADLAAEKNIKLGIVDMSCHSGLSLPIANKNTCVVSSTGTKHFGYGTFATAFYEEMKPGMTMEEAFLNAREKSVDLGFPMISTNTAQNINETIYKLFTPYMFMRHDEHADKISSYLTQVSKSSDLICERELDFKKLLVEIDNFEKIAGAAESKYSGYGKLRERVLQYKKIQDELIHELRGTDLLLMDKVETISYSTIDPISKKIQQSKSEKLTYEAILNFPAGNLDYFTDLIKTKKKGTTDYNETLTSIAKITSVLKRQEELKIQFASIAKASTVYEKIDQMKQTIVDMAMPISELSRKVYNQQYREKVKDDKTPNACKSFKF